MKPTRTWILVADGGRARILEVVGKDKVARMISGSDAKLDNPPSHEQGRDRPVRVHELVGKRVTPSSRDTIRIGPAKRSLPVNSESCSAITPSGTTSIV